MVTFPLAVHQNKLITKVELLQPTLKELTEALKHRVTIESRSKGFSSQAANKIFKKEVTVFTRFPNVIFYLIAFPPFMFSYDIIISESRSPTVQLHYFRFHFAFQNDFVMPLVCNVILFSNFSTSD